MKNTKSLLITLGHNSSAIFVDGNYVIGYEQERLSGIKADSQFPKDAISEIIHNTGLARMKDCIILISHWFDCEKSSEGAYTFTPSKYMSQTDYDNLRAISANINFVDNSFTHHDAHAWSAMSFFNYFYDEERELYSPMLTKQLYTIVADGFGTNQEVLSIYESHYAKDKTPKLIHRVYGYEASLGLMYQYATSFCGMKENQDEYKFLGYEAHITECFADKDIDELNTRMRHIVKSLLTLTEKNTTPVYGKTGSIAGDALVDVKELWHECFRNAIENIDIVEDKYDYTFKQRVAIAYLIQGVIENYFVSLIKQYNMSNVICAGGCFYNVKLNNTILTHTDGLFSAMPLAGDQGAAIGMYHKYTDEQFPFMTLAIGKRRLYNIKKSLPARAIYRNMTKDNYVMVARELAHLISDGNIVNLIIGDMEFGPRALCNTSTLMLPTAENVANNNHMNNRNEVMPCAPVCTHDNAFELFDREELCRVIGSNLFMICTHEYYRPYSQQYAGVMHRMPNGMYATGRPQIVRPGTFMDRVLNEVQHICDAKCLVNTSFNAHGRPIAFDTTEILQNFEYQCEHAREGKEPILFIVEIADSDE